MRRLRALWLVALTAALVLLLAMLFALRQQERGAAGTQSDPSDAGLHVGAQATRR